MCVRLCVCVCAHMRARARAPCVCVYKNVRARARARVCVCECVVHLHCSAQLSIFNTEKRYRNKIIITTNRTQWAACSHRNMDRDTKDIRSRRQDNRLSSLSALFRQSTETFGDKRSSSLSIRPSRCPSGKTSSSRAEDPRFESRLRRDFVGVESYQ